MTTALARESLTELLEKVGKIFAQGRERAKAALEYEEVRTWGRAAQEINHHLLIHDGRAAYGKRVILKVSTKLRISDTYLYDILQAERYFKISHSSGKLTLTHYRVLSRIENREEREFLYRKAVREGMSHHELVSEIRGRKLLTADASVSFPRPPHGRRVRPLAEMRESTAGFPIKTFRNDPKRQLPPLKPRRGRFFTYRIVKPRNLHNQPGFYSVDLGFRNRVDFKLVGIKNPKEDKIITAVRTRENPDHYRFKRVHESERRGTARRAPTTTTRLLYTYKAAVASVHDDDTQWVQVDLGFRMWSEIKIRLRGIDAAEIEKGKKASDFVKRTLAKVPFVVITVSGRDKFGRPLVDLFYLEGTDDRDKVLKEGIYLNQQLLDLGLAKRV